MPGLPSPIPFPYRHGASWAAFLSLLALGEAQGAITLISQTGAVNVLRSGRQSEWLSPKIPFLLELGDRIRTGLDSEADLAAPDGATVSMGPGAELAIDSELSPDETTFVLRSGAFEFVMGRKRVVVPQGPLRVVTADWKNEKIIPQRPVWSLPAKPKGELQYPKTPPVAPKAVPPAVSTASAAALKEPPVKRPDRRSLISALEALDADAYDPAARSGLDGFASELAAANGSLLQAEKRPIREDEQALILRRTYRVMLEQVEDEAVRNLFRLAEDAFDAGRYLLATDRFLLCRLLEPREQWLRTALDEYLLRQIPGRVEEKVKAGSARSSWFRVGKSGDPALGLYRSSYVALRRMEWAKAEREARRFVAAEGAAGRARGDSAEAAEFAERLKARLGAKDSGDQEARLVNVMRSAEVDPEKAVTDLEIMLYRFPGQTEEAWWQKAAEGLRRAYSNRDVLVLLAQARRDLRAGDVKKTMRSVVEVLKKSPGNLSALALVEDMQRPAEAPKAELPVPAAPVLPAAPAAPPPGPEKPSVKPAAQTQRPVAAAAPAPAPKPAPKAEPAAPSLADMIQAQAYYERGLKAYLRADLNGAAEEWRSALKFNPDHPEARKNLARTLKEIGAPGKGGGE